MNPSMGLGWGILPQVRCAIARVSWPALLRRRRMNPSMGLGWGILPQVRCAIARVSWPTFLRRRRMNPSMGLGWGILPQTLLRRKVGQETLPPVLARQWSCPERTNGSAFSPSLLRRSVGGRMPEPSHRDVLVASPAKEGRGKSAGDNKVITQ